MNYWKVTKKTVKKFIEDKPMNYSSSIAFYTIFSLPAILIIIINIAGSIYDDETVRSSLISQIHSLFGENSANTIEKILTNAVEFGSDTFAKVIGIATLVFSATTVFIALQDSLNHIWGIKPKPKKGYIKFAIDRLLSLAMVISIGFLLLVSLIVDTVVSLFKDFLTNFLSDGAYFMVSILNFLFLGIIITVIFAMLFKILPDAKIRWKNVWIGAFVTTLLFLGGKFLIGFYLGNSTLSNAYGAAGSLVLLLVWVYFSSVILLFGAEFTFVYSKEKGDQIEPAKHAVIVEQVEKN